MTALSTTLRWSLMLGALFALIIVPFVIFEEAITAQVTRLMALDIAPVVSSLIIAAALALDVLLPVPASLVSVAAGALLGFAGGALVVWAGMMAGCILGYGIGATGGAAAVRRFMGEAELERATRLIRRTGAAGLVVARAVPVLAEASAIAAGVGGMKLGTFALVTGLANLGIAAAYAAIGAFAVEANSFAFAFAGAIAIPLIGIALGRLMPRDARA